MKKKKRTNQCPCQSDFTYAKCCKPFHTGKKQAETPEALMRSRYSAYVKGEIDYLVDTTDSTGPLWRKDAETWREELTEFSRETTFQGLEVLETSAETVRFEARLEVEGHDASFIETSRFRNYEGQWFYHSGEFE